MGIFILSLDPEVFYDLNQYYYNSNLSTIQLDNNVRYIRIVHLYFCLDS